MKSSLRGVGSAGVFFGSAFLTAALSYPCGNSIACRRSAISTSFDSVSSGLVMEVAVFVVFSALSIEMFMWKGEIDVGRVALVVDTVVDCRERLGLFIRLLVSSSS